VEEVAAMAASTTRMEEGERCGRHRW